MQNLLLLNKKMKSMKKLIVLVLVTLFASAIFQTTAAPVKKDITGEWVFKSTHAPYGYDKGTIIINSKEGEMSGEIKFSEGTKVPMKDVKITEGVLTFTINVEHYNIPIKATIEEGKLKGVAETPEGNIPFEAARPEKKKKE